MPPLVLWPALKVTLGVLGAGAVVHLMTKEVKRINAELERMRAATAIDPAALPTLRRDPRTDEWRVM